MLIARKYGHFVNLTPNDLKLITGILIIICLIISNIKGKKDWKIHFRRPAKNGASK